MTFLDRVIYLFYTYILNCSDNTLYTGYTVDLDSRLETHNKGLGAKYTRGRLPVKLAYYEKLESKSEAMRREAEIKRLNRDEKLELIKKHSKG